jgi:hypothetical protein
LDRSVDLHAAVEGEVVGLVAQGVYVGAGVLAADDDAGSAAARPASSGRYSSSWWRCRR